MKRDSKLPSRASHVTADLSEFDTYQLTTAIILILAYSREVNSFFEEGLSLNLNKKSGLVFLADNAGHIGVAEQGTLKQWAICNVCGVENFVDAVRQPRFFDHTLCEKCAATHQPPPQRMREETRKDASMKVYRIERTHLGTVHATVNGNPLPRVEYHNKQGFDFGNASKGSQDLALSILADYYGEFPSPEQLHRGTCLCWPRHQKFTWRFIHVETNGPITIMEEEIAAWLEEQEKPREQ